MAELNGNGRFSKWLFAALAPPLLGVVAGWVTTLKLQVANHGERIAVIETQVKDTRDELRSINQKIDRLLEHWRTK